MSCLKIHISVIFVARTTAIIKEIHAIYFLRDGLILCEISSFFTHQKRPINFPTACELNSEQSDQIVIKMWHFYVNEFWSFRCVVKTHFIRNGRYQNMLFLFISFSHCQALAAQIVSLFLAVTHCGILFIRWNRWQLMCQHFDDVDLTSLSMRANVTNGR